ncbi:MAG: SEL1-like repeat protein [Bacteroidaceae bacterium]|nr:SEL1-like repeat protein [Bacteroidaceae bacterium]
MKKTLFLILLALPFVVSAQADKKLIAKAEGGDAKAMCKLAFCYERGAGVPHDSTLALQWLRRSADLGEGEAWLCLSRYYLVGTMVPADTTRYFSIRKEWADKGLPNGIAALAVAYVHGFGVKADTAHALELMRQAADKGSDWAYLALGEVYRTGDLGQVKNYKIAEQYFKKALKAGETEAYRDLAYLYAGMGDFKKAWSNINEAMKWNDPSAQFLAARMLYNGHGVAVDRRKAITLIEEIDAANPMNGYGLETLGAMYMYKDDVASTVDSLKAIRCWERGAEQKHAGCLNYLAAYSMIAGDYGKGWALLNKALEDDEDDNKGRTCQMMADIYFGGYGVDQSDDSGIVWLKRGVEKYGDAVCATTLAEHYLSDEYVDEWGNYPLAKQYYMKAVELGDTDALVQYGRVCLAVGDNKGAEEAFRRMIAYGRPDGYYWMAALCSQKDDLSGAMEMLGQGDKKGSAACMELLGIVYEEGEQGIETNFPKAAKYYIKAGTPRSYNNLGGMYLSGMLGKRTPKDIKTGISYIEKSAEMGYVDAIYRLGYMYENGEYVDSVDHYKAVKYFKTLADNNNPAGLFKMGLYYELGDGGIEADSVKSVECYRRAAGMGHGEAMCYLGDFHRIGRYLPLDKDKAFGYYSAADSVGEELGTYYVGRSYLEGCGVNIDTAAAVPYLRSAALMGVGRAAYLLAELYNYGKGGMPAVSDSATRYYLMAYENGSAESGYFIGKSLLQEGYHAEAVKYLYNAARRGNYDAMVLFALCEMEGVGVKADPEDGYSILEHVTRRVDNAAAYYHMGVARINGQGCRQSESLGKLYLDTAAMLGSTSAMSVLGVCYLNGYGCEPDTAEAIKWYTNAIESGSIDACNRLGYLYESREEYEKAVECYLKSVERGSDEGRCCLGLMYEKGRGVVLSHKKAFELYSAAAENGYGRGFLMVAYCYLDGVNVEEDYVTALKWFVKGAEAGHVLSMFNAASMYEDGENGVKRDLKQAKYWYKQAAERGYEPAIQALSRMK